MRRFAGLARMPALVIFTALVVLSVARVSAQESGSPMILPVDPAPLVVETDAGAKSFAVEIADGVKVRVQRGLISSVMVKRKDVSVKAQGEATRIEVGDIQVEATKTLEVLTTASSTAFANNLPVVGSAFNAAVEPVLKVLSIPDIADGMDAPFEERAPDIAEGVDVLFEPI